MLYRAAIMSLVLFALSTASVSATQGALGSSSIPPAISTDGLDAYAHPGKGEVIGRAEFKTKLFGEKIFARQKVNLIPLNDYNLWYVYRMGYGLGVKDPITLLYPAALAAYNRDVLTDDNGNFRFQNVPAGKYIVEFYVDYESDKSRVENNTIYSNNDDDFPTSKTTQRVKVKLRRELDVVASSVTFDRPDAIMSVVSYLVLGTQTCCDGEL